MSHSIKSANELLRIGDYFGAAKIYALLSIGEEPIKKSAQFNLQIIRNHAKVEIDIDLLKYLDSIDNQELNSEVYNYRQAKNINNSEIARNSHGQLMHGDISDVIKSEISNLKAFDIDWSSYFILNKHKYKSQDPAIDYVLSWQSHHPVIGDWFDTAYYRDSYPDIKKAEINPLIHYLEHGRTEGRGAIFSSSNVLRSDDKCHSERQSVVIVSHESSATGAPLLGLNIAKKLSEYYNIISIILREKELQSEFNEISSVSYFNVTGDVVNNIYYFLKREKSKTSIKAVIVNSIVGYPAIHAAHALDLPSILLIHEFAEYMRPHGTCMSAALISDVVVTPAKIIEESLLREFEVYRSHNSRLPSMFVRPQGKLPYMPIAYGLDITSQNIFVELNKFAISGGKIVIAAGYTQIRKGVDLFVSVARYIKQLYDGPCKFVWVGDGFDPSKDLAYSVYLDYEIRHMGLGDDFIYIDHVQSLSPLFEISDVFCLPSRMDPFPNVVIDALTQDLHVACFDAGTGAAEFLKRHNANATVVGMCDTHAMALGIVEYLKLGRNFIGVNSGIVKKHLDFDIYIDFILEKINLAEKVREKSNLIKDYINDSDQFDPSFFGDVDYVAGPLDDSRKIKIYVDNALKGIYDRSPRPGFSNIAWLSGCAGLLDDPKVPFYEALKQNFVSTHDVVVMDHSIEAGLWPSTTYLVHLHVHYVDLLPYFMKYFRMLNGTFDLCITYNDETKRGYIEKESRLTKARTVLLRYVKNIGRDVLPMLDVLQNIQGDYEIFGHFHTKGSKGLDDQFSDRWREFLLNVLIGNEDHSSKILGLFEDKNLGIIFPEDAYNVGVTKNQDQINYLSRHLKIQTDDDVTVFPLGNMFWARTDAIRDLCQINIDRQSIQEPLPYDGTILHAIERILPRLVGGRGFKIKTIHRPGIYR